MKESEKCPGESAEGSVLPNFLIAGGVASGTSFLSSILMHHPDIYLPKQQRPEPNFFHYSWKFNQGLEWYTNTWFSQVNKQRAIGERSSLLLNSVPAPGRIRELLPAVKIIFCLRNPIERAWANYRFSVLEGLEPLSFREAIESEESRKQGAEGRWAEVLPHAYLTRSCYAACLRRYFSEFHRDQILCLKSEDLGKNTQKNLKRVCEFLGVDMIDDLPLPPNYSSPSVRDLGMQVSLRQYFGDEFSEIIEHIRVEGTPHMPDASPERLERLQMLKENLLDRKEPLSTQDRELLRERLKGEIQAVAELVDFSVDDWV